MKQFLKFIHDRPIFKTVLVTAAGGAFGSVLPLLQSGVFEPHACGTAALAGAGAALYGLFVKRPQDGGR